MRKIELIDLIIEDINSFLIKEEINPLKVELIQNNGVPIFCEGDIPATEIAKINKHLESYKDKIKILEIIRDYRYGNKSSMSKEIGKSHLWERYINYVKNEDELMKYLGAKTVIKLI